MNYTPTWLAWVSVTFSLSFVWIYWRAGQRDLERSQALDLGFVMVVAAALGGRLLHVLYEQPFHYLENPVAVFYIWEGGFVHYGALAAAIFTAWLWCRRYKQDFWGWGDFFAPVIGSCYAVGRLACLINGCCYGRACQLPWAVEFHQHAEWGIPVVARHPTQLYAAILEGVAVTFLLRLEKYEPRRGFILTVWLGWHGLNRLIMELFRDDYRGPSPLGFSLGLWVSVALLLFSLGRLTLKQKTPSN